MQESLPICRSPNADREVPLNPGFLINILWSIPNENLIGIDRLREKAYLSQIFIRPVMTDDLQNSAKQSVRNDLIHKVKNHQSLIQPWTQMTSDTLVPKASHREKQYVLKNVCSKKKTFQVTVKKFKFESMSGSRVFKL